MSNITKDILNKNNIEIKINNKDYILCLEINKSKNSLSILIRSKNNYRFQSIYEELLKSYRFFSAFESLEEIKEELNKYLSEQNNFKINFENEDKNV